MIRGQDTFDDLDVHFRTGLANDLTQSFAHFAVQDLVAILGDPNDVKPVIEFGMAASTIGHNLLSRI